MSEKSAEQIAREYIAANAAVKAAFAPKTFWEKTKEVVPQAALTGLGIGITLGVVVVLVNVAGRLSSGNNTSSKE